MKEEPDVGILSCGVGKHCIESSESSLGGFCVGKDDDNMAIDRTLQVVGNKTVFDLAYDLCYTTKLSHYSCDCNIDLEAKSGTLSCVAAERCAQLYSGCIPGDYFDYCLSGTVDITVTGPTTYYYTTW